MTIISHDISAADEPELLKTLASLARRKGARVANRCALPCPTRQRSSALAILKSMSVGAE